MAYLISQGRGIGIPDLNSVYPAVSTGLVPTGTGNLPGATYEPQLGEVVTAYDLSTNAAATGAGGYGEFILLAVPTSTTVTAGLFYYITPSDYKIVVVPGSVSTTVSGTPIYMAINTVASAAFVQYTWFQVVGRCTALKTAVTVNPNVPLYVSATAGRVKVLLSTFRSILGARSANATTVTSTTSTVAIYINHPTIQPSQ